MSKRLMLLSFVILFVLAFAAEFVRGDKLLPNHRNYFEIEKPDTTEKFFPFGWWYTYEKSDITCDTSFYIDFMGPDTNKLNVMMPSLPYPSNSLLYKELKYGISKGLYAFLPPGVLTRSFLHRLTDFRELNTALPCTTNMENLSHISGFYNWMVSKYLIIDSPDSIWDTSSFKNDIEIVMGDNLENDSVTHGDKPGLHVISDSADYKIWNNYNTRDGGFSPKMDWLTFKIKSDTLFSSSDTFKFIAEYVTYKDMYEDSIKTIFVELNSGDLSPGQQGYDTLTNTITVSLQNPDYFSDVDTSDNPSFPLYDRNPHNAIDLYTHRGEWFIVFAQMDKIIYDFTLDSDDLDTAYILDSLVGFEFVGTHYYLAQIGASLGIDSLAGYIKNFTEECTTKSYYDSIIGIWNMDEPGGKK